MKKNQAFIQSIARTRKKVVQCQVFQIMNDVKVHIDQANLLMIASSLAYTTILSIIPVFAVSFAIFQTFGGMQRLYDTILPLILSNLTQGTGDDVIDHLRKFIDNTHAGVVGVGGFVGLIVTSLSMLSSVENAINKMWKTRVSRSFFYRMCSYWVFITLGPLALSVLVGIGISSSVPLEKFLPTGSVLFLIGIALFFFIYKWVPQAKVNSACALISAAITASFWNLARWGYTYYTREIVAYNTVYGSLGAVPILLLWIYIAWVIVLAGVALTVALQRHWTRANREEKACVPTRL